jgi:glycerophosphoryl diester phosphodiesterase
MRKARMNKYYFPLFLVTLLSACSALSDMPLNVNTASTLIDDASSIQEQSKIARSTCSEGKIKSVSTEGFECFTQDASAQHIEPDFAVIAHRGASGFLPEHTKEAAVLSFMQGADYIEQDLVVSKDKQLIVLHDIHLEAVTNVEDVFGERRREDGRYYVIDFTLEELRRLRVHERQRPNQQAVFPSRYQGNAHFSIATFAEHVELISELNRTFNRDVGLIPEIKAAAWHQDEGIDISALVVDELNALKLNRRDMNIYIQSFDPAVLKRLRQEFAVQVKLVQLIGENDWSNVSADYEHMRSQDGLRDVASYADAIGPYLPQVLDLGNQQITSLGARANALGLAVYAYTFRIEEVDKQVEPEDAFKRIKQSGIQGVFTDQVMPYMFE